MATLAEDVLNIGTAALHDVHAEMMGFVEDLPIEELLAKTIYSTVAAVEKNYQLECKGACESNGDPHYSMGLSLHYWGEVCEYAQAAEEDARAKRILEAETAV